MDKNAKMAFSSRMPDPKKSNPARVARLTVDLVLCAAFFAFIFTLLRSHVPSSDPRMVLLWAGAAGACLTTVFWLCVQMFRVVLRAQKQK